MTAPLPDAAVAQKLLSFAPNGGVPNNPELPVVLLRKAVDGGHCAAAIRALYEENGWGGTWTWSVFGYHHFHPNAHEVLTVSTGWGEVLLGGPDGELVRLVRGDAVVLPAGTGHCRVAASSDFAVCGGYPPGQAAYETLRAGDGGPDLAARIVAVPLPETDPLFGAGGPLTAAWST